MAVRAFAAVTERRVQLDDVLAREVAEAGLDGRDVALARTIATVAIKRFGTIRGLLDSRLASGLPRKSGDLAAILATAAAQILFLAIPDHAAVDAAVALAKADHRSAGYAGLANAVLRRIAADGAPEPIADPLVDIPDWLARRWRRAYGEATAQRIAASVLAEAHVDLRTRSGPELWAEKLGGFVLPGGGIRLRERRPVAELPGYAEGAWWVQDAAAALPAMLLAAKPGERVLDLCAAPGGKTAQLAAAGAHVVAVDRSPARMARLEENLRRLALPVEAVVADATTLAVEPAAAVLLDAPCSATGTIRRNPDVGWTKSEADILRFADLQARLIARAFALTQPGGRLVYATCSLEPEEGERIVAAFLAAHADARLAPVAPSEVPGFEAAITPQGDMRILPDLLPHAEPRLAGCDGFYVARIARADRRSD